jgi:tetratricopeptide (TPR) repeat protein
MRVFAAGVLLLIAGSYAVVSLGWGRAALTSRVAVTSVSPSAGATANRRARHTKYATTNIAAYELYERGQDHALERSEAGVRAAIDDLRQAVALDPNYAAAYATLGSRYANAAGWSRLPLAERRTMLARADLAARRALALDDSLPDAHVELGFVLMIGLKPVSAITQLERAAELDRSESETYPVLAKAYEMVERPADALGAARRAVATDSLSASAAAELADALYFVGKYDEALAQLASVAKVQPPLRRAPRYIAEASAALGRWSDAVAVLRPVEREPGARGLLGYSLARSGRRPEALQLLNQLLADEAAGLAPALAVAEVYIGLGDYDRAFVWMDRAFNDYSMDPQIMGPLFRDFRADPRFEQVRRRLGTASEATVARTSP